MAVAADVASLAADDEHDEIVGTAVRDAARGRRGDVQEAARAEQALLALDLHPCGPGVDEVELVLLVVVVEEPLVPGRHHDHVDAERLDPERLAHLAEAVPVAELLDRSERVAHVVASSAAIAAATVRSSPSSKSTVAW